MFLDAAEKAYPEVFRYVRALAQATGLRALHAEITRQLDDEPTPLPAGVLVDDSTDPAAPMPE